MVTNKITESNIDPTPVIEALNEILSENPRITSSTLYQVINLGLTEAQFKTQISIWSHDGTLAKAGFESKKGIYGGICKITENLKNINISESTEETEFTSNFTFQGLDDNIYLPRFLQITFE